MGSHDYKDWHFPRSTVGKLETSQESQWYSFSSRLAGFPGKADVSAQVWRQEENPMSHPEGSLVEGSSSYSTFFSIQSFNWLDEAHLHYKEQPASLSLLIQMWSTSRNTQNHVWPSIWIPHGLVKLQIQLPLTVVTSFNLDSEAVLPHCF